MLKLICTLLISLFCVSTYANYTTPGTGKKWNLDSLVANSGGNVTFSAGSYLFNDTITVSTSDTILINHNATIKMASGVSVNFFGILKVTPPDSVKITAQDTSFKFADVRFEENSDASVLKKVIYEYGNVIRLLDCDMLIDSCVIRNNRCFSTASTGGAINLFRSNATISNCKIYRNNRVAILSGSVASSPMIINNDIYDNNSDNTNQAQINFSTTGTAPVVIRNNRITGLYTNSGGIGFLVVGSANIIIENNIIRKNRYGIAIQSGTVSAYINNNIIDSNNIQGSPALGGSGFNFNGTSALTAICTRNIVRGNLWGVTIQGTAKPNFGNITNSDTTDIGLNQLYWNGNSGKIFDFYNNTIDSIKAQNNYWGTPFIDSVEAHIFHRPDSSTLGYVNFMPIRIVTSVGSAPTTIVNGFKLNDAYPNPFNPATTISFEIARRMNVVLSVYDLNGKLVHTLTSGMREPGKYDLHFDAARLSSGMYFYRLEADGLVETKKLILVK